MSMPDLALITTDKSQIDQSVIIWVAPFIMSITRIVFTKSLHMAWNFQIMINYHQQDSILLKQIFKIWNFKIMGDLR